MEISVTPLILLGFGMGIFHATDVDHVIAVTGLAGGGRPGFINSVRYCLKWAFGHGLVLMLVGIGVFVLGMAIPKSLSNWAESLVGILLLIIGLWVLWTLYAKGYPQPHTQPNTNHPENHHTHTYAAIVVGMVHGLAGSAPVLLLLPIANSGTALEAILYLFLFSVGVFLGMLGVGGLIGSIMSMASTNNNHLIYAIRGFTGLLSIGYGLFLVLQKV